VNAESLNDALDALEQMVRDRSRPAAERIAALHSLMPGDVARGKRILLELANDDTEPDEMLDLVGRQLARLVWANAADMFDLRDIVDRAAEAFFEDDDPGAA
jgi:hypothetical protein